MSSEIIPGYTAGNIGEEVHYEVQYQRPSGTWGVWSKQPIESIADSEIAELRKDFTTPQRKVRVTTKREVVG